MDSADRKAFEKSSQNGFFLDIFRGIAIGIAFIIPGFSGGSVAAILGIYERLVGAIADIFKDFLRSIKTLLPIGLGMIIGIFSLLYPLGWALTAYPFPTVCLFVGLAVGGLPSITEHLSGKVNYKNILAISIPFLASAALSFLPVGGDVNLFELNFGGYLLLVLIGFVASAALVVPGISGSMLMLIFGYYNPIVNMITHHLLHGKNVGASVLVLGATALGIGVGFIVISVIMKLLLRNYPRGTYFAILGFILGSIPTIYVSTAKEAGYTVSTLPHSVWHWIFSVLFLLVGLTVSLLLVKLSRKLNKASN